MTLKYNRKIIIFILKLFLIINLYKAILGFFLGRSVLSALGIILLILVFLYFFFYDLAIGYLKKSKIFSLFFIFYFLFQLFVSLFYLSSADTYPILVSFFQLLNPILLFYVLESLDKKAILAICSSLSYYLFPFILFAFVEFLTPINIRKQMYLYISYFNTGEYSIDVAYYLGDTSYKGLRLGSIFFEPLTFAFVSCFYAIYLFETKKKLKYWVVVSNILSLGKLPIATTLMSISIKFFNKIRYFFILFILITTSSLIFYFAKNFEIIANNSPSMGSHFLGLVFGILNSLETPFLGHGFGTAGFSSLLYYEKIGNIGPFKNFNSVYLNGNESAVGIIAYQIGFTGLLLYLIFYFGYFNRLLKHKRNMMALVFIGFIFSLFLSESVLSLTVTSILLIFSKGILVENE